MPIAVFPIGPLETNAYLVHSGSDAILVDAGGDLRGGLNGIIEFITSHKLTLHAVLLTHMHFDHVLGVAQLVKQYPNMKVLGSKADDSLLQSSFGGNGSWGMPPVARFSFDDLTEGEHHFGSIACTVFATPGHSQGSVSIYLPSETAVFVGDLLFYRSVGRTDLPGSEPMRLMQSLQNCIYTLPPETKAYPGHGPETVVGDEKKLNPFVRGL